MGTGFLQVQVTTGDGALPVAGARVVISEPGGTMLYQTRTDKSGNTEIFSLPAPDMSLTLNPDARMIPYSVYDIDVSADGFVTKHIHGDEILDTQTSILPVHMETLVDEPGRITDEDVVIPPAGPTLTYNYNKQTVPVSAERQVMIPDYITVHLGTPTNTSARNVRVKFTDYIKNVTSSEIYSTWPYNSIVANVHAIVTFALNRVYTEWYPSRGFNFNITNSTAYDQYYREGGPVFENISRIVDDIFNTYAHRFAFRNPFFTEFCNGSTVTCPGMSQWGTVSLANGGKTPLEILRYYYPNDLVLTETNNIGGITDSYPGYALSLGSSGQPVRRMQEQLNRIRVNYPLIPAISNPNGTFSSDTQDAVRTFQRTFNLTPDGIIGKTTWNKINFIYTGVTKLAELDSEGHRYTIGMNPPNTVLSQGSRGGNVLELQFILNAISPYYKTIPTVIMDGVFGASVKNAVIEFQKTFNLTPDGVVLPVPKNQTKNVCLS